MGGRALPRHPVRRAASLRPPVPGHGDPAAVQKLTRQDLAAFHQRWIRPDNARIFIVSDRPLAELTPLLDGRFGEWQPPTVPKGSKEFVADMPAPAPSASC